MLTLLENNFNDREEIKAREKALKTIENIYGWDREFLTETGFEHLVEEHPENISTSDLITVAYLMELRQLTCDARLFFANRLREKWGIQ